MIEIIWSVDGTVPGGTVRPSSIFYSILKDISKRRSVSVRDLLGKSRKQPIARARQEAYFLMREAGMSFPVIGKRMGDRNHSTIIYGVREHAKRILAGEA